MTEKNADYPWLAPVEKPKKQEYVWSSIHGETQKFLPKPQHPSDWIFNKGSGLNLSLIENRTLFALQKLLWQNERDKKCVWLELDEDLGCDMILWVPRIFEFKKADLYRAYGLEKHISKSGKKEYSSNQMKQVWTAFTHLATKDFKCKFSLDNLNPETGESVQKLFLKAL